MSGEGLALDDIQGGIVPGFRNDYQDLLFVRFPAQAAGQRWLRQLYDEVSSAREVAEFSRLRHRIRYPVPLAAPTESASPPPRTVRDATRVVRSTWVNAALTAAGLEVLLGADAYANAGFPETYTSGMVNARLDYPAELAAWQVRDRASRDRAHGDRVAHALLILAADTAADLDHERSRQIARLAALGLTLVCPPYRGSTLGGGREHFGFTDGLSRPDPASHELLHGWTPSETVVAPGEFIVGMPDEEASSAIVGPAWTRNGSYLAFRRLRQHVGRFRDSLDAGAAALSAEIPGIDRELVGAKLLGRWRSGAKLLPPAPCGNPEAADPFQDAPVPASRRDLTAEDYGDDPYGDGCPLFSHVRRAHPRNSPALQPRRHQILRRGIAYGERLPAGAPDTGDRGLLFLAYQSRLADGFEHIQRAWFNDSETPEKPGGAGSHGWDPIVGNVPGGDPQAPRLLEYHVRGTPPPAFGSVSFPIQRFVEVTAGGYFFTPSISALWHLAGSPA